MARAATLNPIGLPFEPSRILAMNSIISQQPSKAAIHTNQTSTKGGVWVTITAITSSNSSNVRGQAGAETGDRFIRQGQR
jgi:hypothetical protein